MRSSYPHAQIWCEADTLCVRSTALIVLRTPQSILYALHAPACCREYLEPQLIHFRDQTMRCYRIDTLHATSRCNTWQFRIHRLCTGGKEPAHQLLYTTQTRRPMTLTWTKQMRSTHARNLMGNRSRVFWRTRANSRRLILSRSDVPAPVDVHMCPSVQRFTEEADPNMHFSWEYDSSTSRCSPGGRPIDLYHLRALRWVEC